MSVILTTASTISRSTTFNRIKMEKISLQLIFLLISKRKALMLTSSSKREQQVDLADQISRRVKDTAEITPSRKWRRVAPCNNRAFLIIKALTSRRRVDLECLQWELDRAGDLVKIWWVNPLIFRVRWILAQILIKRIFKVAYRMQVEPSEQNLRTSLEWAHLQQIRVRARAGIISSRINCKANFHIPSKWEWAIKWADQDLE